MNMESNVQQDDEQGQALLTGEEDQKIQGIHLRQLISYAKQRPFIDHESYESNVIQQVWPKSMNDNRWNKISHVQNMKFSLMVVDRTTLEYPPITKCSWCRRAAPTVIICYKCGTLICQYCINVFIRITTSPVYNEVEKDCLILKDVACYRISFVLKNALTCRAPLNRCDFIFPLVIFNSMQSFLSIDQDYRNPYTTMGNLPSEFFAAIYKTMDSFNKSMEEFIFDTTVEHNDSFVPRKKRADWLLRIDAECRNSSDSIWSHSGRNAATGEYKMKKCLDTIRKDLFEQFDKLARLFLANRYNWFDQDDDELDQLCIFLDEVANSEPGFHKIHEYMKVIAIDGFIMEGKTKALEGLLETFDSELDQIFRAILHKKEYTFVERIPQGLYKAVAALGYVMAFKTKKNDEQPIYLDRSFLSHDSFEMGNTDFRLFFLNLMSCNSRIFSCDVIMLNHLENQPLPWPFHDRRAMEKELYDTLENLTEACEDHYNKMVKKSREFQSICVSDVCKVIYEPYKDAQYSPDDCPYVPREQHF